MKLKNAKLIKYIIIAVVLIIVLVAGVMIYKNLFASSNSSRYAGIENYKLTNDEINSVKDKINELENVDKVDVYINSKIIKVFLKLKDDIEFDKVKNKANEVISSFKEENLKYYDIEFFVDSLKEDSEVYPRIGYKYKTNSEFVW